ncbi:dTDP-4-dehydrorhamnose reductase [Succinatimonas hippei]|uniref:dTDP-4-dehydrorhamnose reductase n=1 Tax=Succinatimonas hippei TaxID=626938 RepID=UPI0026EDDF2D|nr:dTDP-4-dehydrorhamnose reductase [Succinatimonas hippei]
MARVLLTGAYGQVGKELEVCLLNSEDEVISCDHKALDISQEDRVLSAVTESGADIIINAAAYTNVEKAEDERVKAYEVNAYGPKYLAKAAKLADIPLIHISTDYVFSSENGRAHREDDAVEAQCVYGKSKLEGEENIIACCSKYVIVRASWIFGRYGNNFVKTMLRLSGKYNAVSVVSDQKGNPTPARALAEALCVIAHDALKPDFKDYGIYHFAGNPATTWDEFARSVFKYAKLAGFIQKDMEVKSILAKDYPSKAVRPYDSRLDTNKINEVFKIALPDWQDYLPETVGEFFDEQNN